MSTPKKAMAAETPASPDKLQILSKDDVSTRLKTMVREARSWVMLISPYTSLHKLRDLVRAIEIARTNKVSVLLLIRHPDKTTRISEPETAQLQQLIGLGVEIRLVNDLHAKLYLSERYAIMTSLNLLDSSMNNSIEIGMGVPSTLPEYQQLLAFYHSEIKPVAKPYVVNEPEVPSDSAEEEDDNPFEDDEDDDDLFEDDDEGAEQGHCIRCGAEIDFDPARPYCDADYAVWARYKDENYKDSYCHGCGDEITATKRKPLCRPCYRKRGASDDPPF